MATTEKPISELTKAQLIEQVEALRYRVHELENGDGGTAIVRTDVTAQKMAEAALANSEARFSALIENANLGIIVHRHYKPLYANQRFAEMFGLSVVI
jgi:PAS domain-containing protein